MGSVGVSGVFQRVSVDHGTMSGHDIFSESYDQHFRTSNSKVYFCKEYPAYPFTTAGSFNPPLINTHFIPVCPYLKSGGGFYPINIYFQTREF